MLELSFRKTVWDFWGKVGFNIWSDIPNLKMWFQGRDVLSFLGAASTFEILNLTKPML
jgi:hypothetical protein